MRPVQMPHIARAEGRRAERGQQPASGPQSAQRNQTARQDRQLGSWMT
jgi:hypothetical protein